MIENQHKNLRSYIEVLQEELCSIVDMYLKELSNRDKLENAPINQVASALGVIIEKFTKNIKIHPQALPVSFLTSNIP